METHLSGHPPCVDAGYHVCHEPSGRECFECDQAAGTRWGPYWCPDCDSARLDRIGASLKEIAHDLRQQ